ncbi:MAG: NuoM family protein [Promethearchaeota archaeon]
MLLEPTLLLQTILVPIVATPFVYLIGKRVGIRVGWLVAALLFYSTFLLSIGSIFGIVQASYPWYPIGEFGFRLDGLSAQFALIISLLSALIAIYSMPYMKHRVEGNENANQQSAAYFALFLLYSTGMLGAVLATNLIEFYLFFELMLVPSYFIIAQWGYGDREKVSMIYFMWTHIGALVLLAGLLATGFLAGGFNIASITEIVIPEIFRVGIIVAISFGFLVKMAVFGVHVWLPHAHAEAPTPISAMLSPLMIGIGGYGLTRLVILIFPTTFQAISIYFAILALLTMFYGGIMAIAQTDIKRLLAYSSVSQMGYILFGLASFQFFGIVGATFHYISHATCKAILFLTAGAIILQADGIRDISGMGGLVQRMPVTATAAIIGFLGILGFPSTNGFQSEWMIFAGAFGNALANNSLTLLIIAAIGVIATVFTAGYSLWTIRRIFFGELPEGLKNVARPSKKITVPLIILAIITIVLGLYPELVVAPVKAVIESIIPFPGV